MSETEIPATSVLVADDNETALKLLCTNLKKWGYGIVPARDGNEAWDQFQQPGSPGIAILDWQMPGLSGPEVCKKAKAAFAQNPPYILLLTSRDSKEDIVEGLGAGANDFLAKPYDKDVLHARLEVGRRAVEFQTSLLQTVQEGNSGDLKQREEMEKTIAALKKRAVELEERIAGNDPDNGKPSKGETGANILEEIVFVFKRGEINLPSPPQIGIKFKEMMNSGSNLQQISQLLKQDAAVSSKLISISNSAFYRGVAENKTLEQAVGRLGLSATKQYVDAVTNRSLYITKNKNFREIVEKLWVHSLSCAYASQILSKKINLKLTEDAFTLGLLHDIGRLILIQAVGELQLKKKIGEAIDQDDLAVTIDKNHGKFGAALMKRWKFSDEYTQIAACHDHLEDASAISKALLLVHFANLLVKSMGYHTSNNNDGIDLAESESARLLKVDGDIILSTKKRVEQDMEELKGLFS